MDKKKSYLILIVLAILSVIIIACLPNYSMADVITNPNDFRPGPIQDNDTKALTSKAGVILDIATTIGIIISVITLIVLGIKFMLGSIEEKAEYKKSMIPYVVGIVMIGSISTILKIVAGMVSALV